MISSPNLPEPVTCISCRTAAVFSGSTPPGALGVVVEEAAGDDAGVCPCGADDPEEFAPEDGLCVRAGALGVAVGAWANAGIPASKTAAVSMLFTFINILDFRRPVRRPRVVSS